VLGYKKLRIIERKDVHQGTAHCSISRYATHKGNRRSDVSSFGDVSLEVSCQGVAKPGHYFIIWRCYLLEMDHVGFRKNCTSPGNPRGVRRL